MKKLIALAVLMVVLFSIVLMPGLALAELSTECQQAAAFGWKAHWANYLCLMSLAADILGSYDWPSDADGLGW